MTLALMLANEVPSTMVIVYDYTPFWGMVILSISLMVNLVSLLVYILVEVSNG